MVTEIQKNIYQYQPYYNVYLYHENIRMGKFIAQVIEMKMKGKTWCRAFSSNSISNDESVFLNFSKQ